MANISEILKATIKKLPDTEYLRATPDNANIKLDNIVLKGKVVFVYYNLPTIANTIQAGGMVQSNVPIEIDILKLADNDDNTPDGDAIRNDCRDMADRLMDQLKIREDSVTPIPSYQITQSDTVKIYDVILTGVRLRFNWIFDRTTYNCG